MRDSAVVEHAFRCGYAPRTINFSLDSETLFVGCKDGSITVIENLAGENFDPGVRPFSFRIEARNKIAARTESAVRSVCEWVPGWLLVGRNDGSVQLVDWHQARDEGSPHFTTVWEAARTGRVSCMEWLDRSHLLLSLRGSSRIVQSLGLEQGESITESARTAFARALQPECEIHGLSHLICSVPLERQRRWLHISQNGETWITTANGDGQFVSSILSPAWEEKPGLISDYAPIKRPSNVANHERNGFDYRGEVYPGVYVATDSGVYLLGWNRKDPGQISVNRIALPGVGRMCIAMTYYADKENGYLWISDSAGDAHLFLSSRRNNSSHSKNPRWQRSAIRHDASQVIIGFSSWRTLADRFVVGQARRNDLVVISCYPSLAEEQAVSSSRESTLQILLRSGDLEMLRAYLLTNDEDVTGDLAAWQPAALLAELFEFLGEDRSRMKDLREFLRNPDAKLAHQILKGLIEEDAKVHAVELWNHTLLGVIHRYRGSEAEKESLYLGILRWLMEIAIIHCPDSAVHDPLRRVLEDQILFARKWGVLGESYARRSSAALPAKVLAQQSHREPLDLFAYQSLLFQRQVDLEHEENRGAMPGLTAWDLRTISVGERLFVAVSWNRRGIEVYEVVPEPESLGCGYLLKLCLLFTPGCDSQGVERLFAVHDPELAQAPGRDYGHSRAFVLGNLPGAEDTIYLLTASVKAPEARYTPGLDLWLIDVPETGKVRTSPGFAKTSLPLSCDNADHESVYSLLEIAPGLVVVGLQGHRGIAQVALLQIDGLDRGLRWRRRAASLTARLPEGKSIARNQVWTLATDDYHDGGEKRRLVAYAGCNDGQVWRLEVVDIDSTPNFAEPELAGRLGAPVWCLACRTSGGGLVRRLFVGGADGSIVAWQDLKQPGAVARAATMEATRSVDFATVWATWEDDGPVARIHPVPGPLRDDGQFGEMILAVTQQGRAILFSDLAQVATSHKSATRHQRLRVPGERQGRLRLQDTSFASTILHLPERLKSNPDGWPLTRLLSATGDGRLLIHTLQYPLHSNDRHNKYRHLVDTWRQMVSGGEAGAPNSHQGHLLRIAEAVAVASPVAPHVLVRVTLDNEQQESHTHIAPLLSLPALDRQWLSRSVRPFLDFLLSWGEGDADGCTIALNRALERAWRIADHALFVEMMTVVLRLGNIRIFSQADDSESWTADFAALYKSSLECIEAGLKRWLGTSERAEMRARIQFAKHLTDGDVLWKIGRNIRSDGALAEILKARLAALQNLLVAGDPLLSLETLRAANASLIRLGKRLVDDGDRAGEWRPNAADQEMPWPGLVSFSRSLADYATGAIHSAGRVNDALAFEVSRAFALVVCCAPSSAIQVAHWMSEADLISSDSNDQAGAVMKQFTLLERLKVPVPDHAQTLFAWACRWQVDYEMLPSGETSVGVLNQRIIEGAQPYVLFLGWLQVLADQLSSNASDVSIRDGIELWSLFSDLSPGDDYPFSHSFQFCSTVLGGFASAVARAGRLLREETKSIQPELVLFSRDIESWCTNSLAELERATRLHQLFEPQRSQFRHALLGLREAARKFPESAAVQKNIVLSVLGHGLLESLDEHILELEEIAQALDPMLVWSVRDGVSRRSQDPKGEFFASHLLTRSLDAESIPRSLRNLQGLLDSHGTGDRRDLVGLRSFVTQEFVGPSRYKWQWVSDCDDILVHRRDVRFLRLTLKELVQNDRQHGPLADKCQNRPEIGIEAGDKQHLILKFPLEAAKSEDIRRLRLLKERSLQGAISRHKDRGVVSHGTGLYLANLAAAVIGWRLMVSEVAEKESWFSLILVRVHGEVEQ